MKKVMMLGSRRLISHCPSISLNAPFWMPKTEHVSMLLGPSFLLLFFCMTRCFCFYFSHVNFMLLFSEHISEGKSMYKVKDCFLQDRKSTNEPTFELLSVVEILLIRYAKSVESDNLKRLLRTARCILLSY